MSDTFDPDDELQRSAVYPHLMGRDVPSAFVASESERRWRSALRPTDPEGRGKAGTMPAGRVLIALVLTLAMAAVFNSGRLAERASQQPVGDARDRALAVWEPIDTVAGAVGLQLPRSLFDRLREGGGEAEEQVEIVAPPESTTTTVPIETGPRVPTAADPLRVLLVGDSTMETPAVGLQRALADSGVATTSLDTQKSSGFARPDFFDWPARLVELTGETNPEVVVAVFGGNDGQGIVADGVVLDFGTPEWQAEYGNRVQGAMETLASGGAHVFYVGQATMRDADYQSKMVIINQISMERAALVEGVTFVDSIPAVSPAGYNAYGPGTDGTEALLREKDGIHLTLAGGEVLAAHVMDIIRAEGYLG